MFFLAFFVVSFFWYFFLLSGGESSQFSLRPHPFSRPSRPYIAGVEWASPRAVPTGLFRNELVMGASSL